MEAFFFTCDNVIMHRKDDDAKDECLFAFWNGDNRPTLLRTFTAVWSLVEKTRHCSSIHTWLANRCAKSADQNEMIKIEMKARLEKDNLVKLLIVVDQIYAKPGSMTKKGSECFGKQL